MKKLFIATMMLIACAAHAQTWVDGYTRRDGTYVPGHYRSNPDQHRYNNYSAENSIYGGNPYTGQRGSQRDEFSSEPVHNNRLYEQPQQQRQCTIDAWTGRRVCF